VALTPEQQQKLAKLVAKVQAGETLSETQQATYLKLLGKSAGTNMPTATAPAAPTPYVPPTQPGPGTGFTNYLPTTAAPTGLTAQQQTNLARLQGMQAAGEKLGPNQQENLARLTALSQGQAPPPDTHLGPKQQDNLNRLLAMQQSGQALNPTQQQNLTRLMGIAAQGGQQKQAFLQGPNSPAGLSFEIPASLANFQAPSVSASSVSAGAPTMPKFDEGTLRDIAAKLGLDFGKLTTGLSAEDYLANRDPSYQYQQDEAARAIQASAAAQGGVLGGGTLKALQDRAAQIAALDYQNAYARDMANRQLGLGQLAQEFSNRLGGWQANAGYDVSNRGMDLQAGIANANNSLQAGIANASNALAAQGLLANMTQNQWDAQLNNRAMNLQQLNDTFNRDLAAKNFGLQGLQFAANQQQNQFNNNLAALQFGAGILGQNQNAAMAGQNFGLGLLQANQANQGMIASNWLNNDWLTRNWQSNTLGNLLGTGYGAAGSMGNYAMNRSNQAGNAAAGYGNAAMQGSLGAGQAWGNAIQGVNNALQGGMGNYLLLNYLGNKGTGTGIGGAIGGNYSLF